MKAGHYISIFDIGEAADMEDEVRPAALGCQLITGLFDFPVG